MNWIILIIAGLFRSGFHHLSGQGKRNYRVSIHRMVDRFRDHHEHQHVPVLYRATLTLPMGTAYAVWTGIGAVGTVLVGIFLFFKEPAGFLRLFFIFLLIGSIIGLKVVSKH